MTRRYSLSRVLSAARFVAMGVACVLVLVLSLLVTSILQGCGIREATRTLEQFRAVESRCDEGIRDIVDRTGTTAQQDLDDLDHLHAWCREELAAVGGDPND